MLWQIVSPQTALVGNAPSRGNSCRFVLWMQRLLPVLLVLLGTQKLQGIGVSPDSLDALGEMSLEELSSVKLDPVYGASRYMQKTREAPSLVTIVDSGKIEKYGHHHGTDTVRLTVKDNGVGIPAENLTRIFSHGFTTRRDGHGFGLHSGALAAKEMGGKLSGQSDGPGLGATFTLELPMGGSRQSL